MSNHIDSRAGLLVNKFPGDPYPTTPFLISASYHLLEAILKIRGDRRETVYRAHQCLTSGTTRKLFLGLFVSQCVCDMCA